MNEYIDYGLDNASMIPSKMDKDKSTVIYIHGYTENLTKESVKIVVEGIF